MTNPNFAELKEKLTEFDEIDVLKQQEAYELQSGNQISNVVEISKYQHTKSSAIITELLDIIRSQSEAANEIKYQCARTYNTTDANEVSKLENVFPLSLVLRSLSETNTRLQKLRDNK